jgi:hypothetical protein
MFKILNLTFRVLNFKVIRMQQNFLVTITYFSFLFLIKHKLLRFLSMSKWLERIFGCRNFKEHANKLF